MIPIVPALIPTSEAHAKETLEKLRFSPEVHLDVVDGQFTPQVSWPYDPVGDAVAVKPLTDQFTLEVDLMVKDPLSAAVDWITAGADMIVFHVETISLENFAHFADYTHVSVGVSMHGYTPLDTLVEYAESADYIQLMGIHDIGSQGQPFDEAVFAKIEQMKSRFPNKPISVDGSVNAQTIVRLKNTGADRFIVGSAITLDTQPAAAHRALSLLIN